MSGPSLRAKGLVKQFRGRRVVDGVDIGVAPGEVVGLLGPNGAGKTTSFNMIVGLLAPDAGVVELNGADVSKLPMHRRARLGLGYLPQESSIFRRLTVRQNLLAVLELMKVPAAQRVAKADATLADFGLTRVADSFGDTLSGGERRRAEIARSLVSNPTYLLFDEPFAGVDPINVAELQKLIRQLTGRGLGVLITDHNVRDTLRICDRAYILASGRILEEGTPEAIASSPKARSAYLGEGFSLS